MDGQPVWLCSVSYAPGGRTKATGAWSKNEFAIAERLAHETLAGVGDSMQERAFRMNITFCIHRAVSGYELEKLPTEWECSPGGLAGGPVQVLWSRGVPHRPAASPCRRPGHLVINDSRPDLWVPEDCGQCEPCLARLAIVNRNYTPVADVSELSACPQATATGDGHVHDGDSTCRESTPAAVASGDQEQLPSRERPCPPRDVGPNAAPR